jgi:hypothetical protein
MDGVGDAALVEEGWMLGTSLGPVVVAVRERIEVAAVVGRYTVIALVEVTTTVSVYMVWTVAPITGRCPVQTATGLVLGSISRVVRTGVKVDGRGIKKVLTTPPLVRNRPLG